MPPLKAVLVIFAIVYCDSQVQSNPRILSTVYDYFNYNLIIGKNHIHKASLVYALCTDQNSGQEVNCRVILDATRVNYLTPVLECPLRLKSELGKGQIDVLGVDLWGEDKAIFSWQEISNELPHARVTIETIHMTRACASSAQNFLADGRQNMIPQVFIIPDKISYHFGYLERVRDTNFFIKVTVDENNRSTQERFSLVDRSLIHSWQLLGHHFNTLLITVGRTTGRVTFYELSNNDLSQITEADSIKNIIWTTNTGVLSICTPKFCETFSDDRRMSSVKEFDMDRKPTKYAALYSLPHRRHLAMVCDEQENSDYRVIKIGPYGEEEYTYTFRDLKCARTYQYFTAKFYMKNINTEYCLSLFYSEPTGERKVNFQSYCFHLPG